MTDVKKLVGNRIREIRKEMGYSQESLGEKAGFHYTYLGRIERGEKNISLENLEKIANALGVGVHQFFSYAYELEQLTDRDKEAKQILQMLMKQTEQDLRKAKNILTEIFNQDNE